MLSTTAEYALRIMIVLAEGQREGLALTSGDVSERTKVPTDYTVKVLQWLGRAGLVRGRRGRGGGFRLQCDPATTTLLQVVNAIDPVQRLTACPLGREAHRSMLCPLHSRIDEVAALMEEHLGRLTIQGVIDGAPGGALCREESLVKLGVPTNGAKAVR